MIAWEECPGCLRWFRNRCLRCGYQKPKPKTRRRNKNYNRGDIFYTPHHAIYSLLRREDFSGTTWEPAQGDGRIVRIMQDHGCHVFGSDITDGTDFLETIKPANNIVTNPPWSIKDEWLAWAKRCAINKIALLLELNFLTGVERQNSHDDKRFPLASVYVFPRPLVFDMPDGGQKPSMSFRHAWYVWDKKHKGETVLRRISAAENKMDQ